MKTFFPWKKVVPHLIAIGLFFVVVISFFSPIFFEGKKLFQGDIPQHEGIKKQLIDYRKQTGKEPLWSNAVFSGMPAYLLDVSYQEPLHTSLQTLLKGGLPPDVGLILAALVASYLFLLALGINPYLAIAGSLAYGLSAFTLISIAIGHDGKVAAMAYMPLVLAGIHLAYHYNRWLGGLLTAFGLSLEISATHPQVTYYLAMLVLCYGANQLWVAIQTKTFRKFIYTSGILVLAAALAIGANFGRLWSLYEYGKSSIRGSSAYATDLAAKQGLDKSYAFMWSLGKAETMTLLVPYFYGGSSHEQLKLDSAVGQALTRQGINQYQVKNFLAHAPTYRGDQPFTEGPMYLGIVICFFYLISLWVVKPLHRYWLLAGTLLAIVWCWGKNFAFFNDWMYHYFPGYNKFRAVTTAIVMAQLTTVTGACLGINHFLKEGFSTPFRKGLIRAGGSLVALLVMVRLAAGGLNYEGAQDAQLPIWLATSLQLDRKMLLIHDINRGLLLLILSGLSLLGYAKNKLKKSFFCWLIILLVGVDAYTVGKRYVRDSSYQHPTAIAAMDAAHIHQEVLQDTTLGFRVLDAVHPFTNGRTSYYYKRSVGGYHAAKLRRYQDLIEYGLSRECQQVQGVLAKSTATPVMTPLLNMLNTRYFMTAGDGTALYYNADAYGPVWFVRDVHVVAGPRQALEALDRVDLKQVAVFDSADLVESFPSIACKAGTINLQIDEPNYLQYAAEIPDNGLAVFSEIFYQPGWYAWLDDQPVTPLRANYLLRALPVPAGKHTITFKFQPQAYVIGGQVMWIVQGLLLLVLLIGGGRYIMRFYSLYGRSQASV
jgi:hypothetical protein